jgi:serine/threonine protein kinase/tetratricopeptide (TPR) repeat protein
MSDDNSERFARLNQLADEFAQRYRRGECPSLHEYTDRHPDLAEDIREFFPALVEIEQANEDRRPPPAPAADSLLPPPQRLGDYRIVREIGRGGMGVVYEAEQVSLGRHVAIKILSQRLLDPYARQRFEREARAAARLHHTNIVPVFGVGEHEGMPYYVMQFIPGLGLDAVLEELKRLTPAPGSGAAPAGREDTSAAEIARSLVTGRLGPARAAGRAAADTDAITMAHAASAATGPAPAAEPQAAPTLTSASSALLLGDRSGMRRATYWQSVARIGVQVADALEYARQQGILHRDIKPANLLLDRQGTVWVTDFGLAKADDQQNLTQTGDVLGTVRYMAPERFHGCGDVRADVYALGLTLYELLTLRPAYAETAHARLIVQILHSEPPRPRALNPAVPRDLETVVLQATARDPAHRYQTPGALAEDLKRFLEDRPVRARQSGPLERAWRWCRRNPRVAALLGLVALLVSLLGVGGAVAAVVFSRQAEHQRELARKADEARRQAEEAKAKALSEAARASAEALKAKEVTGFLVGLFEPRDRLSVGRASLGFRDRQDALLASDLLRRGIEKLRRSRELKDRPLVRAQLLHSIGSIYFDLGHPPKAQPLLEEALRIRRAELPADHPDLANTLRAVAEVRFIREDFTAIDLFREALAILGKQPEPDGLDMANAQTSFAVALWQLLDRSDESQKLLEQALAIRRKHVGEHDLQTLTTLFLIVLIRVDRGETLQALPLVTKLLAGLEESKAHPELLHCARLMVKAWQAQMLRGATAAAGPARQVLKEADKVFGKDHYLTFMARTYLAGLLYDAEPPSRETLEEVAQLYRESLVSLQTWGVPRRHYQAAIRLNLGRTLLRLGARDPRRNAEAEVEFREAIALYRAAPPGRRPGVGLPHSLQLLGWILMRQGDPARRGEVGKLVEEAYEYCRANPSVAAYRRAFAFMDAGHWRLLHGDSKTSAPLFAQAAEIWRTDNKTPDSPHRAEALAWLYAALSRQGQAEQAETARQEAERILRLYARRTDWAVARPRAVLAGNLPPWGM